MSRTFLITWCLTCSTPGFVFALQPEGPDPNAEGVPVEAPFTMSATFDGETQSAAEAKGVKLTALIRKAQAKVRRLPVGEPTGFEAIATLNGSEFRYDNPTEAGALLTAIGKVKVALARQRLTLTDLGSFAELPPAAGEGNEPKPTPAQVKMWISQRAQALLQEDLARSRRLPNPQRLAQFQRQAYDEARRKGWLDTPAPQAGPGVDPRQAQIESLRNVLIPILRLGTEPVAMEPAAAVE